MKKQYNTLQIKVYKYALLDVLSTSINELEEIYGDIYNKQEIWW